MKNHGNMTPPKEYSKPPVVSPKKMESQELPYKGFKIIALKMCRELQENIDKQFNNIRKGSSHDQVSTM